MKRTIQRILLGIAAIFLMAACHEKDETPTVNRTVLVYMVAQNNLGQQGFDRFDLDEMESAVAAGALRNGGRLFIYRNASDGSTTLSELKKDGTYAICREYSATGETAASLDPQRMSEVVDLAASLGGNAPMGLVLWSHGTGWMDESVTRSFGLVGRARMSLTDLSAALEGKNLDWIYFDCCHMGTVEVFYELRNSARRIVASATELPVNGMPYDLNLPVFFAEGETDLVRAARNTFEYYDRMQSSADRFCTMAVVETNRLDGLATATRRIMEEAVPYDTPGDYWGVRLQRGICTIYDMRDYLRSLRPSAEALRLWDAAFDDAVLWWGATPSCLGLDLSDFSGLGCGVILDRSDSSLYGYDQTAWWSDVASHNAQFAAD
ncbi:MAG: clostripain-related cysteine peptidase [Clostridium sp.]|nr:clostripain-related cysteine peptidase [Clostridium sp.]